MIILIKIPQRERQDPSRIPSPSELRRWTTYANYENINATQNYDYK